MIQGTASGVGKTILVTALCRIFKQDGYKVSPFKAQNITTNVAFTKDGDEIAVSQLLQAYAAGTEPEAAMNPLVLKPSNITAGRKDLIGKAEKSYSLLSEKYEVIVIEGAGSPVELNIKRDDMVNMGVAKLTNAPVILVSDIDRGGVFASLYGTLNLLTQSERKHVKATIVNRFKGDITSFVDGVSILEKITTLPVAGVVPYMFFDIPEEDSLYSTNKTAYEPGSDLTAQFDLIAETVRRSLDMQLVYRILNEGMGFQP